MNPTISSCLRTHSGRFVRLRPLVEADAEVSLGWRLGKRASLLNSGAATVEQQARWIASRPSDELNFMIELMSSGQAVGMLSLLGIDLAKRTGEPARFLIGEEEICRDSPVAVESMKLLYEIAFDQLNFSSVYGAVLQKNKRMLRWQKYMSMKETGILEKKAVIDGREEPLIGVELSRQDYQENTLPLMERIIEMAAQMTAQNKESNIS